MEQDRLYPLWLSEPSTLRIEIDAEVLPEHRNTPIHTNVRRALIQVLLVAKEDSRLIANIDRQVNASGKVKNITRTMTFLPDSMRAHGPKETLISVGELVTTTCCTSIAPKGHSSGPSALGGAVASWSTFHLVMTVTWQDDLQEVGAVGPQF